MEHCNTFSAFLSKPEVILFFIGLHLCTANFLFTCFVSLNYENFCSTLHESSYPLDNMFLLRFNFYISSTLFLVVLQRFMKRFPS